MRASPIRATSLSGACCSTMPKICAAWARSPAPMASSATLSASAIWASSESAHFTLGHGAHEAIDRTAASKGEDGRDRLHAELPGDARMLVDIDLDELDGARLFGDHLFERRRQLATRTTPGGPEIDQHGHIARGFDDIGAEAGIGGFADQAFGNGGCGTGGAIHGNRHKSSRKRAKGAVAGLFAPARTRWQALLPTGFQQDDMKAQNWGCNRFDD